MAPKTEYTGSQQLLLRLLPFILIQQTLGALCFPISKYGLAIIEPFTFAFFRFAISGVVLVIIARWKERGIPIERRDWWRILLLGFLIIPLNQTGYLWGQSLTAAGHGSILFATTPIWVFILAVFHLKEKMRWRRAVGIVIALIGAMVIMLSGAIKLGTEYLFGDLIILLAVWAWAYYTILGKPLIEKYGATRVTAYALASGSLMYLPFGLSRAIQFDYSQATVGAWLSVIYMAIGASVFAYLLWSWLLKHMEASRLAVFSNMQPVIATAVAWMALGEQPTTAFFIGAAVVLAGVILTEV